MAITDVSEASEFAPGGLVQPPHWGCGDGCWRAEGVSHAEGRGFREQSWTADPGLSPHHPRDAPVPHGAASPPGITAWDSVLHVLMFAIKKFSGPSSVLKLVPTKNQIISFAEKGLIARGTAGKGNSVACFH